MGAWDAPVGLLTHHLDHDEPAWGFLERFIALTRDGRPFEWVGLRTLAPPTPRLVQIAGMN